MRSPSGRWILIDVKYEDLPAVFDPEEAMTESAPQLHPEHAGNLVARYRIRKGDMAAGWAAADVVVEGEYETTWQEHAYLQPEAGLSYIDEQDRVTVVVAGQWTHEDQEQIYHALDLPPEQVRVIYPAIGGAFGGREDMTVQIILAPGHLETAPACQDSVEPRRVDPVSSQASSDQGAREMGRYSGRTVNGGISRGHWRRRRLQLHLEQSLGQRSTHGKRTPTRLPTSTSIPIPSTPITFRPGLSAVSAPRRLYSQQRVR